MPYGLKDIELQKLCKVFESNERIERVVLYGSRAKGNYKPFSDVDITLIGEKLTHTDLNHLSLAIDDLLLPYQFDISIFHTLKNKALIDHIHRVGITIYERESEWKEYKFSDFVDINPSVKIPKGIPIPFVEMKDLDNSIRYCESSQEKELSGGSRFINGDTLFARITPCLENGKICQVRNLKKGLGFGSTEFHVFRGKEGISDTDFVYYLSRWDEVRDFAEHNLEGSSGRQRVSKAAFDNLYLTLPPLDTQCCIASILTSLDDKIDLLRRENATLEAMAESLFRQWFVVEAKEEWEEGKLGDYVIETIGGEWGKENPEGDFIKPVQCIRGTDIADLSVGLATKTPIRYIKESKFEKIEPRNGDIIMEISGGTENQSTGRVAYVNDDIKTLFDYPIIFSNFCRLLRVKEEHTYFIYCYLRYLYDQDEFFNLENGSSGIKNLDYKALLYELTYPVPDDRQQILDFNDKVSVYFEKINRNKQQIQTLIQTRDGLLPRLMGGEIRV